MGERTTKAGSMEVSADAKGFTSRAGTALMTGLADLLGLTDSLTSGLADMFTRRVKHAPGAVLRDIAVVLADGGDALTDLGALRDQGVLFGEVASDATAYRTVEAVAGGRIERVRAARAAARARAWEVGAAPSRVILDIDATLITAHSEKEGAAGTYKRTFGFHPLLCFEAESGEGLAGMLRPGNAAANTAADHITILDRALAQLPDGYANPGLLVRCDSGGATHAFTAAVASSGYRFSVGVDLSVPVREGICEVPDDAWEPAIDADGCARQGAWVAELDVDLASKGWPAGTRAICRKERPHPGAQLRFTDEEGYRFQVFLTNQRGSRIARLEQLHRSRTAIEDCVRCGKDTGLRNLPFRGFALNEVWLELVLMACDLMSWTKRLLLTGEVSLLRAQAAALPRLARRGQAHPPRAPRAPAPATLLAVGRRARISFRATGGAARRLTTGSERGQPI